VREGDTPSHGGSPAATPTLDSVFELLSVQRRRQTLYCLHEASRDAVSFDNLVDGVVALAAAEDAEPPARQTVARSLHHVHLPELAGADIVDYDPERGRVRYRESPSLEEWLEHARYKELE
jgi:hypothetical protein